MLGLRRLAFNIHYQLLGTVRLITELIQQNSLANAPQAVKNDRSRMTPSAVYCNPEIERIDLVLAPHQVRGRDQTPENWD